MIWNWVSLSVNEINEWNTKLFRTPWNHLITTKRQHFVVLPISCSAISSVIKCRIISWLKLTKEHCKIYSTFLQEEEDSAVAAKMATRRRGRKPAKFDNKLKLERSQQSARECRARKKLRYQYLEELVASREKAIVVLRKELDAV